MDWIDRLRELICKIYQEWGGDCADLFPIAETSGWIDLVIARYENDGAPTFGASAERQDYLNTLDELEAHLALPGNTLSQADTQRLQKLIDDLRLAIGA